MDITVPSYIAGPLLLAALFAACTFCTVGAKTLLKSIKIRFFSKPTKAELPPVKKEEKAAPPPRKKPRTVKSIEINPDDVDRIYVRKSS